MTPDQEHDMEEEEQKKTEKYEDSEQQTVEYEEREEQGNIYLKISFIQYNHSDINTRFEVS